jgi:hypothetical protein
MSTSRTNPKRVRVVANETVASDILHVAVRAQVHDDAEGQVLVVAPALNSRLRHWASDNDAARRSAELRLEQCLARLAAAGVRVEGLVGDADPVQAIDDALRAFPADGVVIATHPDGRSNWLARDLVGRASARFGLPITHIVVDDEERRETLASSWAGSAPAVAA